MWDEVRLSTIGSFSLRKIAIILTALLLSAFAWAVLMTTTAFAVNAEWNGDNLTYEGQTYVPESAPIPGVPQGSQAYVYKQPAQNIAHVIFFSPGADVKNVTSAQFQDFTYSPPSNYSNPQTPRQIAVTPSTPDDRNFSETGQRDGGDNNNQGEETACAIKGVGWIVCPISRFLAWGMDRIFDILKDFLEVAPLSNDTNSSLYRMWETMRGFANLAFIAAFFMIIYAQVTNMGLDNYNIKKMLPKLIVAAVLVNISYWICAVAVDLSNIAGHNLQTMFMDLRETTVGANTQSNTDVMRWESMTNFILSAGTIGGAAVAGGIGLATTIGAGTGVLGLVIILLPFLVGVLFAIVIAVLVLAARQALITILIVIAPLAFVAYLLPNTEKWFDKWKDVFMTMLLVFPIFSVLFGGAQLAGAIIIQNAKDLNVVLLGMFVQVAPIVITPLLVRFSGGLLGRFAGIINNPTKGVVDRTRNWSGEKLEEHRKRRLSDGHRRAALGQTQGHAFMRNWATYRDKGRHERAHRMKTYDAAIEKAGDAHYKERLFKEVDANGEATGGIVRRQRTRSLQNAHRYAYASDLTSKALDALDETERQNALAGQSAYYKSVQEGDHGVVKSNQDYMLQNIAAQSAKRVVNSKLSAALEDNADLRTVAGGIDPAGAQRALAQAIQTRHADRGEALKNINAIIDDINPSSSDEFTLATGGSLDYVMPDGTRKKVEHTRDIQEAAIKRIAGGGNIESINRLAEQINLAPDSDIFLRTAFVDALRANSSKPTYFSAGLLDNLSQGQGGFNGGNNRPAIESAIIDALKANKFDAKGLTSNDKSTLDLVLNTMRTNSTAQDPAILNTIRTAIDDIVKNEDFKGAMGNRKAHIKEIGTLAGYDFSGVDW